ncbi:hypothetical protein ACOMHN_030362 [Nucella lapillus]
MAATFCRLGMKEAAVFVCSKHSQVLALGVQRCEVRHHSSFPPPSRQLISTKNIGGFELSSLAPPGNPHPRPVVVLIGWLNAKRKHLHKYQELYWEKGFDVLTMRVAPIHIVRPKMGIKYTAKLLNVLQENKDLANRQVVVHGFSIGAFIYTQLQLMLQRQQQKRREQQLIFPGLAQIFQNDLILPQKYDLSSRISGLVLDSPAYIDHMCRGIANSVTANPFGRAVINNTLLMYLAAFPKSVAFHYHESHRIFHDNMVPTLILHSAGDLISSAEVSERYLEEWRQKSIPAFTCKFPDSSHVSHFRNYPEEYTSALRNFIDYLDLQAPKIMELEDAVDAAAATEESAAATEVQPLQAKVP